MMLVILLFACSVLFQPSAFISAFKFGETRRLDTFSTFAIRPSNSRYAGNPTGGNTNIRKIIADIRARESRDPVVGQVSKTLGAKGFGAALSSSAVAPPSTNSRSSGLSRGRRSGAGSKDKRTKIVGQDAPDLEQAKIGRVSVYCVGESLNLVGLRAHVFRRSFGTQVFNAERAEDIPELYMTEDEFDSDIDNNDEVLHVSNAPHAVAALRGNSELFSKLDTSERSIYSSDASVLPIEKDNNSKAQASTDNSKSASVENNIDSSDKSEMEWKAYENLLMGTQDIFYYGYGCVVLWGLSAREERAALEELREFTVNPVSADALAESSDVLEFCFDRKKSPQRQVKFDRMRLKSLKLEEKLALSYAMAQSSKLFVFETNILQSLEETRYLPHELAEKGHIRSSTQDLNRLIGQLFVDQTEVNLFSSILDTPDFLWEDDEQKPAYESLRTYLEVDNRVNLLNNRLGVMRELLDVLTTQVESSNSSRLEWIVIWLIAVEIIMGIVSNPLFAGKRLASSLLVPAGVLLYKTLAR